MNVRAKSLELFFIDGRPDGMLTAEVFNWTGHVLRLPRTQIKEGLKRAEANNTGVYILLGEDRDGPLAYIGEAETIGSRLRGHVTGKDWWDTAILISTTADILHKAHAKYLESRLVEIARQVGSMRLENGNTPPRSSLSEAAQANMESFLETLGMVLPAIRVDFMLDKTRSATHSGTTEQPTVIEKTEIRFSLNTPKHNLLGQAVLSDGEWIVKAGSRGRTSWKGSRSANTHYFLLHDELVKNGTIRVEGEFGIFEKDYAFSSPSAAGAIINGRSTNGRTAWREVETGKTFAEWEAKQLLESEASE